MKNKFNENEMKNATYNLYMNECVAKFLNKCNIDDENSNFDIDEFINDIELSLNENKVIHNSDYQKMINNITSINLDLYDNSKKSLNIKKILKHVKCVYNDYKNDMKIEKSQFINEMYELLKNKKIKSFALKYNEYNEYNEIVFVIEIVSMHFFTCESIYEIKNVIKHIEYFHN